MRRDVKVGLAVGVVLFAVLVTYLLVVSGQGTPQRPGAPLAGGTGVEQAPPNVGGEQAALPPPVVPHDTPRPEQAPPPVERAAAGGIDQWDALLMGREHMSPAGNVLESRTPDTIHAPAGGDPHNSILDPGPARGPAGNVAPTTRPARTHVIRPNENFWTIAQTVYGNGAYSSAIAKANPNVDPTKLRVDMTINLPDPADVIPAAPTTRPTAVTIERPVPAPIDPNTQYRVQEGESLYTISAKVYGRADRWERIYQANKPLIGDDPHRLKVGMVLQLPEKPTTSGQLH